LQFYEINSNTLLGWHFPEPSNIANIRTITSLSPLLCSTFLPSPYNPRHLLQSCFVITLGILVSTAYTALFIVSSGTDPFSFAAKNYFRSSTLT